MSTLARRVRRWLLVPVLAVAVVAGLAAAAEAAQEAVDARTHPAPGQLVDVGGRRLHLRCTGAGSPTVVLEPGLGASSPVMGRVAAVVATGTRVCVYDRAGRGWSDPSDHPMDGLATAADLHALLHGGHVDGPYVLAGHSFGGLYALTFAAAYPDEVAGLVLVDSTAPRLGTPLTSSPSDALGARALRLLPAVAHVGLARLAAHVSFASLPEPARTEAISRAARAAHVRSVVDELTQGAAIVQQAAACTDLGRTPLLVLTAGEGHDAAWIADQDHLATLSRRARHQVVPGVTHSGLVDEPDGVTATGRAVLDVVDAARNAADEH